MLMMLDIADALALILERADRRTEFQIPTGAFLSGTMFARSSLLIRPEAEEWKLHRGDSDEEATLNTGHTEELRSYSGDTKVLACEGLACYYGGWTAFCDPGDTGIDPSNRGGFFYTCDFQ
jgi:hypothetical protein